MIIAPYHGLEPNRETSPREFVASWFETGQDTAIVRGEILIFDLTTDNTNVSGINQNTKGIRVKHTTTATDIQVAGFAMTTTTATTSFIASHRGEGVMVQQHGYMSYAKVSDTGVQTAGNAWVSPSTVAGVAQATIRSGLAAPLAANVCGYIAGSTINGTQNMEIIIRNVL